LDGEQNIANMGGLKSKMKWTHLVFLIGTLAIVGFPPLAGFFSKDEILAVAFSKNIPVFIGLGLCSVFTAWYMFRLYFSTFQGEYRGDHHKWDHAHESPMIMLFPLFVLAILSIIGGFFGMPEVISEHHAIDSFLKPSIFSKNVFHVSHTFDYMLWTLTVLVLALVMYLTYKRYTAKSKSAYDAQSEGIEKVLSNKYWLDEIYELIIIKPLRILSDWFNRVFERVGIDDVIQSPGFVLQRAAKGLGILQSGSISYYILSMIIGFIIFFLMFIKK
jgi:NADH-quinone oxidoreductase subunit L